MLVDKQLMTRLQIRCLISRNRVRVLLPRKPGANALRLMAGSVVRMQTAPG